MSRYIDADKLEKDGWNIQRVRQVSSTEMVCETKKPTDFPVADVQEVRHGRWEKNSDTAFFWKCSECGAYLFWRKEEYLLRDTDEPNYCPNCGSRMDLEKDE